MPTGTVTDVYRNIAFVKVTGKVDDGGFIAAEATKLELIGGSNRPADSGHNFGNIAGGGGPAGATGPASTPAPTTGGYRRGARLEGKRVRIIKGPFKGQLAQVREDHDTRVQVSLEAKFRVVTIPKDCVRLEDEDDDAYTGSQWDSSKQWNDDSTGGAAGDLNNPPPGATGSLSEPPQGYVPPSSTPYTPAPWSK
jgi:hypothetical protein